MLFPIWSCLQSNSGQQLNNLDTQGSVVSPARKSGSVKRTLFAGEQYNIYEVTMHGYPTPIYKKVFITRTRSTRLNRLTQPQLAVTSIHLIGDPDPSIPSHGDATGKALYLGVKQTIILHLCQIVCILRTTMLAYKLQAQRPCLPSAYINITNME